MHRSTITKAGLILGSALILLITSEAKAAGLAPEPPNLCLRGCWGARYAPIQYANVPNRAIIHHTAGSGDYNTNSQADSAANVRAIQNLHMDANGWSDIGYHWLVDKLGNIFEGRAGSYTDWVIGTHTYAANSYAVGINLMGYYHPPYSQEVTEAGLSRLCDITAWEMPNGWNPYGNPGTVIGEKGTSPGSLCGHNDANYTACPGENLYGYMDEIKSRVKQIIDTGSQGGPPPPPAIRPNTRTFDDGVNRTLPDQRIDMFAVGTDGVAYENWQPGPNMVMQGWAGRGGTVKGLMTLAQNNGGAFEAFCIGMDNTVLHQWWTGSSWTGWQSFGGTGVSRPVSVLNGSGRQEVFVVGTDNSVWHKWQEAPDSGWSGWVNRGGSGLKPYLTAACNDDGRAQFFVIGGGNQIYTAWWTGTTWSPLTQMLGLATAKPAVVTNKDGRLELFYVGTDNGVHHQWQTAPSSGWGAEGHLGGVVRTQTAQQQQTIQCGRNADGRKEVFVVGADGALHHRWEQTDGTWNGGWESLGGAYIVSILGVENNQDGRLEVFVLTESGGIHSICQSSANGGWPIGNYNYYGGTFKDGENPPAPPSVPAAPSNLAASGVSASQVNLSWTDNSGNETNFVVARSTTSGGPYTNIATLGAGVTSYSNTGLAANTTYYYVVRATNASGASANSNQASAVTWPAELILDNAAAGFTASINWSTGTSAADKYGTNYRFRSTAAITDNATFSYSAAQARNYEVYAWWSAGPNRSATAPHIVSRVGGATTVSKNQQVNGGSWQSLGIHNIAAGANTVKVSCWTTTGYVVMADAIRVTPR